MKGPGTALVTGASAGIGRELAGLFARDRWRVVLVARDAERLRALAAELETQGSPQAVALPWDLAAPGAAAALARELEARGLAIDALVNNAGFGTVGPFAEADPDATDRMILLNVGSLTALTRALLPGMAARRRGAILNVASTAAFQPGPLMAVYYATKAYVLSFSEALSNELADSGVTVTALCPGPTATEFQRRAGMDASKAERLGWMMTARAVALAGYRGMLRGTRLVIPGFANFLIAESVRFTPRALVLRVARFVQEQALRPSRPR